MRHSTGYLRFNPGKASQKKKIHTVNCAENKSSASLDYGVLTGLNILIIFNIRPSKRHACISQFAQVWIQIAEFRNIAFSLEKRKGIIHFSECKSKSTIADVYDNVLKSKFEPRRRHSPVSLQTPVLSCAVGMGWQVDFAQGFDAAYYDTPTSGVSHTFLFCCLRKSPLQIPGSPCGRL